MISACASFSLAFLMMYSAYKLNDRLTIYSLDVLLSQFRTSLLFHVSSNLLLDMHTDFSGGRSGVLVFGIKGEISTTSDMQMIPL